MSKTAGASHDLLMLLGLIGSKVCGFVEFTA